MLPNTLGSITFAPSRLPARLFHMSKRPQVIGLAGKAGSGKDTIAALLRMRGYERRAMADALREEIVAAIRDGSIKNIIPQRIDEFIEWRTTGELDVYAKPMPPFMRRILQWWGTEYRRAQDPLYWIQRVAEEITTDGYFVISDVRFANEAEFVRSLGGRVWLVKGRGGIDGVHDSESINFECDEEIDNSGSIYQLAENVAAALKRAIE